MTRQNGHREPETTRDEAEPRMRETGAAAGARDGAVPLPPAAARERGFADWASF